MRCEGNDIGEKRGETDNEADEELIGHDDLINTSQSLDQWRRRRRI
jgi:hypothetical protein